MTREDILLLLANARNAVLTPEEEREIDEKVDKFFEGVEEEAEAAGNAENEIPLKGIWKWLDKIFKT